jgi:hypothetical protein
MKTEQELLVSPLIISLLAKRRNKNSIKTKGK